MVINTPSVVSAPAQIQTASIYIVDDEAMIGEVVEVILNLEGYRPRFFQNPIEALEAFIAADPKPDLLLTDFVMSPMNGMELIERCRQICPEVKCILYSGNVGQEITQFYSSKPDGFLSKPFLPKALTGIVQTVLAK
jgi:two-component system cell cycle sensor histidine kinase/response regulator CckA